MSELEERRSLLIQPEPFGVAALRTALERREREGGTVGANLVLCGALSPRHWAAFLEEVTGLDRVEPQMLESLSNETFSCLPRELVFDAGLLPIYCATGALVVALCDPLEEGLHEDLRLFAGCEVGRVILGIELMARYYPKLAGRPWRVEESALKDAEFPLDENLRDALYRMAQLDAELNAAHQEQVSVVELREHEDGEPLLELTRARRSAAATLDRADGPSVTEAERPRIAGKERGASRHYLSPVEAGEAIVAERPTAPPRAKQDSQPKIIIDMGLLEADDSKPKLGSTSVLIDPSLLGEEPSPSPSPPTHEATPTLAPREPAPAQPQAKPRDPLQSELLPVVSAANDADEWEALAADLDSLQSDIMDVVWDEMVVNEPSSPRAQALFGPSAGETRLDGGGATASNVSWFDPHVERGTGRVSEELRQALRALHEAAEHEAQFAALARVVRSCYERALVFRFDGDQLVAVAAEPMPHGVAALGDDGPRITASDMPAVGELLDARENCLLARLPRPAYSAVHELLPNGPALAAVLCPLAVCGRAVLLAYADSGPGREATRQPELWRLLLRETPRALLRLALRRKWRLRWDLK